jgi:hypothetical protein
MQINQTVRGTARALLTLLVVSQIVWTATCNADVVADWDIKAIAVASTPTPIGERETAIVHLAMFDAVNSIERRYRPYLVQLDAPAGANPEAAAASAAATALAALHPEAAARFKSELAEFLGHLSADPRSVSDGARLGEQVAAQLLQSRANEHFTEVDPYRPKTRAGQYVPTAPVIGATLPAMHPLALASASQFRPGPPPALTSHEWAADYNEVKSLGSKSSTQRTAQQTETAKFWLMTGPSAYHPLARQVVAARHMSLVDSAHFMAVFSVSLSDAYIAVFDAKYRYEFWRPITAIRNADIDGNPATDMDATWQPIDATPMHPEYPCAHCIASGAARAVIESLAGTENLPELSLTSPTAPGVTHRWSNLEDFTAEVANARVWAGFHYRTSARVGTAMGQAVGQYVVAHVMQRAEPTTKP